MSLDKHVLLRDRILDTIQNYNCALRPVAMDVHEEVWQEDLKKTRKLKEQGRYE